MRWKYVAWRLGISILLFYCIRYFSCALGLPSSTIIQYIPVTVGNSKKIILDWTGFFGEPMKHKKYMSDCPLQDKCILINDKSKISQADAVIFHVRDFKWKNIPAFRNSNQRFVFFSQESPITGKNPDMGLIPNYFNWTMGYRRDSDIPWPYGYVKFPENGKFSKKKKLDKNFLKEKDKLIVWLVSNCDTYSKRELIVKELQKYMQINIFGKCGQKAKICNGSRWCENLDKRYKFYISFENSICKDYISEKYWNRWNHNSVPIVLRRKIYETLVPFDSFIPVDDFKNASQMAKYLQRLDKNEDEYLKYFQWKTLDHDWQPKWNSPGFRMGFCGLCEKLLNDQKPKIYENVQKWFSDEAHCKKNTNGIFARKWSGNFKK